MDEKEKEALEKVKAAQKEAAKEASEEATKGFKAQLDEAENKAKLEAKAKTNQTGCTKEFKESADE